MDTIVSIVTVLFIIVLIAVALTFGLALLIWFMLFAMIITGVVMLKHMWYRWRFTRGSSNRKSDPKPQIIEVEFKDID